MFGVDRIYLALGAAAALLLTLLSFYAFAHHRGYEEGKAVVQADWDAYKLAIEKQLASARVQAETAAASYEELKANQRTRIVTVTKEVNRAIDNAPAWRDAPIPDGVRDALAAATPGAAAARQSDRAVPGAGTAAAADQRRPGLDLDLVARRLGGLRRSASSPG